MEIFRLRTFLAVAEEKRLTLAAERLFISQPAVSAQIKALEDELEVPLFTRTSRGMRLTDAGRLIKPHAERVVRGVAELTSLAKGLRGELVGEARVGLNTDPVFLRVAEFFTALRKRHPRVEFHLMQGLSGVVKSDIKSRKLDAGFVFGEPRSGEIQCELLGETGLMVVGPRQWREKLEVATLEDLATFPWVLTPEQCPYRTIADDMFDRQGLTPTKVIIAELEAIVRTLVEAGDGLGLLRRDEAEAADREGTLAVWHGDPIPIRLYFAYLKERRQDPIINAMALEAKRIWREK